MRGLPMWTKEKQMQRQSSQLYVFKFAMSDTANAQSLYTCFSQTAHPASNASHKTKIQSSAISVPWLDDPVVFSGQSLHNLGRASRELVDPIWLVFGSEQELAETIAYIVEGFQGDAQKAVLYDEEVR